MLHGLYKEWQWPIVTEMSKLRLGQSWVWLIAPCKSRLVNLLVISESGGLTAVQAPVNENKGIQSFEKYFLQATDLEEAS